MASLARSLTARLEDAIQVHCVAFLFGAPFLSLVTLCFAAIAALVGATPRALIHATSSAAPSSSTAPAAVTSFLLPPLAYSLYCAVVGGGGAHSDAGSMHSNAVVSARPPIVRRRRLCAAAGLCGAVLGAVVAPLDAELPWQVWPYPSLVLMIAAVGLARAATFIFVR